MKKGLILLASSLILASCGSGTSCDVFLSNQGSAPYLSDICYDESYENSYKYIGVTFYKEDGNAFTTTIEQYKAVKGDVTYNAVLFPQQIALHSGSSPTFVISQWSNSKEINGVDNSVNVAFTSEIDDTFEFYFNNTKLVPGHFVSVKA